MGKYVIDETTLRDIANKIRSYTGSGEEMTPVGMPSEIDAVWEDGKAIGEEVYGEAYEAGKKAEYDARWDVIQDKGEASGYGACCFAGKGWTDSTFKPKYNIILKGNMSMLFYNSKITNLCQCLENAGVTMKCENLTNASQIFSYAQVTHLPVLDFSAGTNANSAFAGASKLKSIEGIISSENTGYSYTFSGCSALEHIIFGGVIGKAISFSDSPLLDDESRQSIIDNLKDLTGATAQTLTFHATVGGKLTQAQKDAISAKNWTLVY